MAGYVRVPKLQELYGSIYGIENYTENIKLTFAECCPQVRRNRSTQQVVYTMAHLINPPVFQEVNRIFQISK